LAEWGRTMKIDGVSLVTKRKGKRRTGRVWPVLLTHRCKNIFILNGFLCILKLLWSYSPHVQSSAAM